MTTDAMAPQAAQMRFARTRYARTRAASAALAAVAVMTGCSSGEPTTAPSTKQEASGATTTSAEAAPATSTTTTEPRAARAEIRLDHYAIEPADITVAAGTLTLAVANVDRVVHDVVLLRTDRGIDALPTTGILVDETDPAIEVVARTARLDAGEHGDLSATLGPGRYVLVCTVPHHYVREAMAAALTVTG